MRRSLKKNALALLAALGLGASAAWAETVVADTALGGGGNGSTLFYLAAVNGQKVEDDALRASVMASRNNGPDLVLQQRERAVPAGKVRLSLVARHAFAAPVQTMFRSQPAPAEEEVEVELEADHRYRIKGALDAYRNEVWLEDEQTGKPVASTATRRVQDPAVEQAMAGASYTCCNLHYEGDWISDANWSDLPFVPAGARIVLKDYGRQRAEVLIDGRKMRIGLDYGRKEQTREQFVGSLIVKEDPRQRLASFPAEQQEAIRAGKLRIGMSKEQVIMSLGYPRADLARSPASEQWLYHTLDEQQIAVVFGPSETVVRVDAGPQARSLVLAGAD